MNEHPRPESGPAGLAQEAFGTGVVTHPRMMPSLRHRILLTLVPLLAILAILGGTGVTLLFYLGGEVDKILRENYESVQAMERLNEGLERIDSSFQFALAGKVDMARQQYAANWELFRASLEKQQGLITLPGEAELVGQLSALSEHYREQGEAFFGRRGDDPRRRNDYFAANGQAGLLETFKEIKHTSREIIRINRANMDQANQQAKQMAVHSLIWFGLGLAAALAAAAVLALRMARTILGPIHAVSQSALAIGAGDLDQTVPVPSGDELGQLAIAFNTMAAKLRAYREAHTAQLHRAQQISRAAINSFPEPVFIVDCDGSVEIANPGARQTLGVVPGETLLMPSDRGHLPDALWRPLVETLRNHCSYLPKDLESAIQLHTGVQDCFFLPRIAPIADQHGNILGAKVLLEDVTRLRLLDQLKTDLVATASHELKTPLATLRLALHWLLEEIFGPLVPKQREIITKARDNAERLLVTINTLLDLARFERGHMRLDLRPEEPGALLRAAAQALGARAAEKSINVVVEVSGELPPVTVDVQRLGYALRNLFDNAVTYSAPGGQITLRASSEEGTITLSVADTGVGIPSEYLPQLFEKFFRVPNHSKGDGVGLGLAIVREIVTAHGGTVSCASRPGEGTTFFLNLPAWSGSPAAAESHVAVELSAT